MDKRDKVFDLMVELADYTHGNGLPLVSRKLEEALDAFLAETGRVVASDAGARMTRGKRRHVVTRHKAVRAAVKRRVQAAPVGLG